MKLQDHVLASHISYFARPVLLVCDERCDKAWGINNRPKKQLSDNEDDYEFLSDDKLDTAPIDTGISEGGHKKPKHYGERHNKWCARECERAEKLGYVGRDLSKRTRN